MFSTLKRSWIRYPRDRYVPVSDWAATGRVHSAGIRFSFCVAQLCRSDRPEQSPPGPDAAGAATAKRNANLRQGPGTNYAIVGGVTAGQVLEIVARNEASDRLQLVDGRCIFAALVEGVPAVPVAVQSQPAPAAAPVQGCSRGKQCGVVGWWWLGPSGGLFGCHFPGGRERITGTTCGQRVGATSSGKTCSRRMGKGAPSRYRRQRTRICADSMTANPKGDVGLLEWKASRGGTYRFEWDFAPL